jgi:cell shape-determining protein MreC
VSKRKKIHSVEDAISRVERLEAENKELRSLWSENEGDIIQLNAVLTRFLRLKWYQRLFIRLDDQRLYKDSETGDGK